MDAGVRGSGQLPKHRAQYTQTISLEEAADGAVRATETGRALLAVMYQAAAEAAAELWSAHRPAVAELMCMITGLGRPAKHLEYRGDRGLVFQPVTAAPSQCSYCAQWASRPAPARVKIFEAGWSRF